MDKVVTVTVRRVEYFTRQIPVRVLPPDLDDWSDYIYDCLENEEFGTDPWSSLDGYDIIWGELNDT